MGGEEGGFHMARGQGARGQALRARKERGDKQRGPQQRAVLTRCAGLCSRLTGSGTEAPLAPAVSGPPGRQCRDGAAGVTTGTAVGRPQVRHTPSFSLHTPLTHVGCTTAP